MDEQWEKPYRSIAEVSEELGVKPHVLRYWETQFPMLRPKRTSGGARLYRPKDLAVLREIRHLLYDRGFTIAGARKTLAARRAAGDRSDPRRRARLIQEIRAELVSLQRKLSAPPS